jgi:hypothetical protein
MYSNHQSQHQVVVMDGTQEEQHLGVTMRWEVYVMGLHSRHGTEVQTILLEHIHKKTPTIKVRVLICNNHASPFSLIRCFEETTKPYERYFEFLLCDYMFDNV